MVLRPTLKPPVSSLRVPPPPPSMPLKDANEALATPLCTPLSTPVKASAAPASGEGEAVMPETVTPGSASDAPHETDREKAAVETGETGGQTPTVPVSPVLPGSDGASPFNMPVEADFADDVYTPAPTSNPVVNALVANGLYLEDLGGGFHRMTCPWASEHPPEASSSAGYLEPCFGNPIGQFRCTHDHTEKRDAQSLIDHLGITPDIARAKAVIFMQTGETHRAAAASERVLAADGRYFNARGPIVRIINPSPHDVATELVNDQTLSAFLASKIDYYRKVKGNQWERSDPPASIIQSLRYCQDRHHLRSLTGLSRQPFYGADGLLVSKAGYDEATGTYAVFDEADYNLGNPTREDAERELDYLKWLLREFHFATNADQAAALAAILTAPVRASLPLAPAININAPRSGGGKSFLAALIALAASASEPYNASYPTTQDEATKMLLAMLLEKPAVILFDDMQVQTGWKSLGPVNKALTSSTITERVLSRSRTATARTNVLFIGTGNNVEPGQDMRRRVVSIRLAPRNETPTLESYKFNPVVHVRAKRSHIVQAALTIIEAHRLAGRPVSDVPPIGSYEEWSMTCRQPLLWLGEPDPATSLIKQVQDDADQDALGEFLQHWFRLFGDEPMMVREVVPYAARDTRFADALDEIEVMDGAIVNTKRFGWYLKRHRSRWANGLRIESGPNSQRNTWRVVGD